ncbi:MAG TPA: NAD(P)-dependent oxidoreductase [Xanthobacteraceae bacterium]|nr:NAD(P)-dependent oxidoreductase [Xanthobacteraceae bacterium]
MRVLVTGGSGFLGSHIADALSAAGHETIVFDLAPSRWLRPDQKMVVGDILDADAIARAMCGCEAVYHLAAMADINEALDSPRRTVEVNVMGTVNVLEAARIHSVRRVIFASSIYVYSNQGSFYRTTKQACENLVNDYHERFGLAFTVLRFGSLYGPRADRSNSVFRLLSQALAERRIDYYGTGEEVREYIHVLDAASMSVDVLGPEFANQYIHLTGRERMTSRDMLTMIREIMGGDIELNFQGTSPTGHYVQSPYNYTPKLGRRLMRSTYIDLGLGILDYLQRIDHARETELAEQSSAGE